MKKKNSVLIFIFHSFLFFKIYSKKDSIDNICPNNGNLIPKKLLMEKLNYNSNNLNNAVLFSGKEYKYKYYQ